MAKQYKTVKAWDTENRVRCIVNEQDIGGRYVLYEGQDGQRSEPHPGLGDEGGDGGSATDPDDGSGEDPEAPVS